jgi:hypothetical protein
MNRIVRSGMFALACVCMQGAWAQQNGAPPGNTSSQEGASGKSAGVAGGAGAAGQSGTDPATLRRSEEARLQKQHGGAANGASSAGKAARKDWKE